MQRNKITIKTRQVNKQEFGYEIKYHTVRSFMIRNFGSKLKTPRKSHYKKDEVAFDTFKKTS